MNTPIVDAEAGYEDGSGCWKYRPNGAYVPADLARQLERDRALLKDELKVAAQRLAHHGHSTGAIAHVLASLEIKE